MFFSVARAIFFLILFPFYSAKIAREEDEEQLRLIEEEEERERLARLRKLKKRKLGQDCP